MAKPTLVIMAAGLGSRYGGLKQIDPVGPKGQIIMQYSIFDAYRAGFRRLVFLIRRDLEDAFEQRAGAWARELMEVSYAYQTPDMLPEGFQAPEGREKPYGTGHAVWCVRDKVKGPFAVINADDFYGPEAFQRLYAFLSNAQDGEKYHWCMAGYQIENTLSESGGVARGVCQTDADGFLTAIDERLDIARRGGRITDETGLYLAEGTPVSMNLWGFTPSVFDELDALLRLYLEKELPQNPLKAECFLPRAADIAIREKRADVKVLKTSAKWYGVTYKQDKPAVMRALAEMTEQGIYPA